MATFISSSSSSTSSTFKLAPRPPSVTPSPPQASLVFSGRRRCFSSDVFGLKIQHGSSNQFVSSFSSRSSRVSRGVGASIVCGASSDTALDVPSVDDETWESLVLKADTPVMVEFWAPWCGPCRMIHPVIAELSKQYIGRLKCYNLNTDDYPSIATQFGLRSIPTIMIFVNGEKKDVVVGAVPKTALTACIEKFL